MKVVVGGLVHCPVFVEATQDSGSHGGGVDYGVGGAGFAVFLANSSSCAMTRRRPQCSSKLQLNGPEVGSDYGAIQ